MKELGYHSISAFIRDAIPDGILTVGICLDPVKYDYSHSIRQLITAIPTLEKDGPEQRKSLWTPAQHSRSRFSTHPPPCQQDQSHRRGTRWQVGISDQAARGGMRRNRTYNLVSLSSKFGLSKSTDTSYSSNPRN